VTDRAPHHADPRPPLDAIDLQRTAEAVRQRLFGTTPRTLRVGRFVVEGFAGDGAMGRVYVAHDPTLERNVALKMMHAHVLGGADRTEERSRRLLQEAKALAKLAHPNVVPVYEIGEIDGDIFVAMELVEGSDLREWLVETERSWRDVVSVFIEAAQGLAAAHAVGLVHRDFKPANVLVGKDGRARVVDFGLARLGDLESAPEVGQSGSSRATGVAGTPAYMAPELLAGVPASPLSDQYSLSVALHEALHGALGGDRGRDAAGDGRWGGHGDAGAGARGGGDRPDRARGASRSGGSTRGIPAQDGGGRRSNCSVIVSHGERCGGSGLRKAAF
jgi:serine/threonine protein kinase